MTQSDKAPPPVGDKSRAGGILGRIQGFDSWIKSAASLSIVTLLAGWIGTYIQYLNAYEQKVSDTAQADLKAATDTFVEISNAYAEAQMLQQVVYFGFRDALNDKVTAGEKAMATGATREGYADYVKKRNALRQNSNIYARKAELYIDWPSDIQRDAADTKAIDGDPLKESVLGAYDFDCDARANLAHYAYKNGEVDISADDDRIERNLCADPGRNERQIEHKSHTILCFYDDRKKAIDHTQPALIINWHSAKHHLLVMHFCFEQLHDNIETARIWASGNPVDEQDARKFLEDPDKYQASFDREVVRLDNFMSLVMSQLERIRVKYRPSSFYCNLPIVNHLIDNQCTPVRIARNRG